MDNPHTDNQKFNICKDSNHYAQIHSAVGTNMKAKVSREASRLFKQNGIQVSR
jgi:hypothetical protein